MATGFVYPDTNFGLQELDLYIQTLIWACGNCISTSGYLFGIRTLIQASGTGFVNQDTYLALRQLHLCILTLIGAGATRFVRPDTYWGL